jgi:hypothetical protein
MHLSVRRRGQCLFCIRELCLTGNWPEKYDIIDFELGNKITGAGFPVYKGKAARSAKGMINFFLDEASRGLYRDNTSRCCE